jgi:hypothetical protein
VLSSDPLEKQSLLLERWAASHCLNASPAPSHYLGGNSRNQSPHSKLLITDYYKRKETVKNLLRVGERVVAQKMYTHVSKCKKNNKKNLLGRGWGHGGEMTQALYAHMNNKTIKKNLLIFEGNQTSKSHEL